ncbi:MAG: PGF-pre-PGF domain-containing protein [Candidatus Bathyarchaeota archaeon]|nr:PGF-pre-PGF domain-containing protein [Candidatus Bathyarchaeota archaeon]
MPGKHRLRAASASMLQAAGKNRIENRKLCIRLKSTVAAVIVLLVLLILCETASADTFFPQLYQHTIVEETVASEASTTPSNVFFIDFTKYAAQPFVRNMTVELNEPVAYFSCALNVVSEKPFYADIPDVENVSRYYTIRFLSETTSKIANVTLFFAIEKDEIYKKAEEATFTLYRYDRSEIYECPIEKIAEDDDFLYFKTTTKGYSFIAFVRTTATGEPWWPTTAVIAIVMLMTSTAVIVYKRLRTDGRGER